MLALALLALAFALPGCATLRRARAPAAPTLTASVGGLPFVQTGAAAIPATAASTTTTTAATIPPGVAVTAHPDGSLTWVTAAPLALAITTREDRATGPAAFTPPAPPTPADEARGFGVRAFYLAALGAALAAGFAIWRGYPLAALCLAGAAAGLPILANVVSSGAGVLWGAILAALAAGLVIAYHLTRPAALSLQPSALRPQPSP